MPGDRQHNFVIGLLEGIIDWCEDNPDRAEGAKGMWDSDGNSSRILRMMIEARCKQKAEMGEVSQLEPYNSEDGAEEVRKMIKGYVADGDDEVCELIATMKRGSRK